MSLESQNLSHDFFLYGYLQPNIHPYIHVALKLWMESFICYKIKTH